MNSATLVLSLIYAIFIITLKNLSNKFVAAKVDGILIKHILVLGSEKRTN